MKRIFIALTVCFLLPGCGLFGSDGDGRCDDGREGLFIQTDRDSYQVGEEAALTVENCTSNLILIDGGSSPDYELEKEFDGDWKSADGRGGMYSVLQEIEKAEIDEVSLPIEPDIDRIDEVPGVYRYELEIYDKYDKKEDLLQEELRRSNTFEVTE